MIGSGLKYIILSAILIIMQIILDEFVNNWYMIYITICPLFILTLPLSLRTGLYMLLSFVVGISIDIFSGGLIGINAASAVAIAFCRRGFLKMIFPPALLESINTLTLNSVGTKSFLLILFIFNIIFFSVYIFLDLLGGQFYLFIMWMLINVILNMLFSFVVELFFVNKLIVRYRE